MRVRKLSLVAFPNSIVSVVYAKSGYYTEWALLSDHPQKTATAM